jgi:hypothetical protein
LEPGGGRRVRGGLVLGGAGPGDGPAKLIAVQGGGHGAVLGQLDGVEHGLDDDGLPVSKRGSPQLGSQGRREVVGVEKGGYEAARRGGSLPFFGWAKIIRPATVCSTRVTVMSRHVFMCLRPFSTTIMVPSSR